MNRLSRLSAIALLAGLAACGSPEQPAEEPTSAGMEMDGPYAASMMEMMEAMEAAVGVDAADTWVKQMIAHHEGAIDMSRIVLGLDPTDDVARMARMTIENQGKEIEALRELAREGDGDPASARLYARATDEMHDAMIAASGDTPSETYLSKMLEHHRGAVAMSDIALANGAKGAVRAQILETRTEQQAEIEMVEAMLSGDPMPASQPTTPAATQPKPKSRATERSAPAPKSAPTPSPTAPVEPDPHAGHDMDSM